jgi:hypothetical protein
MSQKLFIPNIGTLLILAEDWTFKLYFEDRNKSMIEAFGGKKSVYWGYRSLSAENFVDNEIPACVEYEKAMTPEELSDAYKSYKATNSEDNPFIRVTLPKDTQLKLDRIYIRQGAESFSSITFRTTKISPDKKFASKRFWAKLKDANEIVADFIG